MYIHYLKPYKVLILGKFNDLQILETQSNKNRGLEINILKGNKMLVIQL